MSLLEDSRCITESCWNGTYLTKKHPDEEILPKKCEMRQDQTDPGWVDTRNGFGFLFWSLKKHELWTASSDFFVSPVGNLVIADANISIIPGITDIESRKKTSKILLEVNLTGSTLNKFKQNKVDATLQWQSCVNTSPHCQQESKTFKFQSGMGKVKAILECVSKESLQEMKDSEAQFEFTININIEPI